MKSRKWKDTRRKLEAKGPVKVKRPKVELSGSRRKFHGQRAETASERNKRKRAAELSNHVD